MTAVDLGRISQKLIGMSRRLARLFNYRSLTFEEYLQDEDRQASIERYLEIVIQASIDINKMLIKNVETIDLEKLTNTEIFVLAGELGFISSKLATQLALSAGFRNVLAHVYDNIDPEVVYRALQLSVVQYPQYIQQIQTYLDLLEANEQ